MNIFKLVVEAHDRCPKQMWNGPCGGSHDGTCELGGRCAWAEIMNELRNAGMENEIISIFHEGQKLEDFTPPRVEPSFFSKDFVVTTELAPFGEKEKIAELMEKLQKRSHLIDAVNVTDNPMGKEHADNLMVACWLMEKHIIPILQVVCRNKSMEVITSKLLAARIAGINHVLLLTGDYSKGRKAHFFVDSTCLAWKLKKDERFCTLSVGVALNPNAVPLENELLKFRKKMKYADFAQTQAVFSFTVLEELARKLDEEFRRKVIVGVLPLISAEMVEELKRVPGMRIDEELIKAVKKEGEAAGIERTREMIKLSRELDFRGVHLMCFNKYELLDEILSRSFLR